MISPFSHTAVYVQSPGSTDGSTLVMLKAFINWIAFLFPQAYITVMIEL